MFEDCSIHTPSMDNAAAQGCVTLQYETSGHNCFSICGREPRHVVTLRTSSGCAFRKHSAQYEVQDSTESIVVLEWEIAVLNSFSMADIQVETCDCEKCFLKCISLRLTQYCTIYSIRFYASSYPNAKFILLCSSTIGECVNAWMPECLNASSN